MFSRPSVDVWRHIVWKSVVRVSPVLVNERGNSPAYWVELFRLPLVGFQNWFSKPLFHWLNPETHLNSICKPTWPKIDDMFPPMNKWNVSSDVDEFVEFKLFVLRTSFSITGQPRILFEVQNLKRPYLEVRRRPLFIGYDNLKPTFLTIIFPIFIFNSPVTEIFPFSYFAFCLLAFSQLITDIKNIMTILKTRPTDPYFG